MTSGGVVRHHLAEWRAGDPITRASGRYVCLCGEVFTGKQQFRDHQKLVYAALRETYGSLKDAWAARPIPPNDGG